MSAHSRAVAIVTAAHGGEHDEVVKMVVGASRNELSATTLSLAGMTLAAIYVLADLRGVSISKILQSLGLEMAGRD